MISARYRQSPPVGVSSNAARSPRRALVPAVTLGSQDLRELETQTFQMEERLAALKAQISRDPLAGPKWVSSKKLPSRGTKAQNTLSTSNTDLKSSTVKLPPLPAASSAPIAIAKTWAIPDDHQKVIALEPEENFKSKALALAHYDEEESQESFQEALNEWRASRMPNRPSNAPSLGAKQASANEFREVERFDEAAASEDFANALKEWRDAGQSSKPKQATRATAEVEGYDEVASANEFHEALLAWRNKRKDEPVTAKKSSEIGSIANVQIQPELNIEFSKTSSLSEEDQLLLKHARLQKELGLYDQFIASQDDVKDSVDAANTKITVASPDTTVEETEAEFSSKELDFLMGRIAIDQM